VTLQEIGDEFGITRERVRQIEAAREEAARGLHAPADRRTSGTSRSALRGPHVDPRSVASLRAALKREGVSFVFTLCGGHVMSIYDGCLDEGIGYVGDVRPEACTARANAWAATAGARVTGQPGALTGGDRHRRPGA